MLCFPSEAIDGPRPDTDLAADYLELCAFFNQDCHAFTQDLVNASEINADEDYDDVDSEIRTRERIESDTANRIRGRSLCLGEAYPFKLDESGDQLTYGSNHVTLGRAAYLISLILSNLRSSGPMLDIDGVYPNCDEIRNLREYFQHFATSAMGAEIQGQAWSFGYPRPDRSGFEPKLRSIWSVIRDGSISPDPSAPASPNDDQIDVLACRKHPDDRPGCIIAAAQVATGQNWQDKSLLGHFPVPFWGRWFDRHPVSQTLTYHIIPFARPDDKLRDDVLTMGNLLHRIRLPRRVSEAEELIQRGIKIEARENLYQSIEWLVDYRKRVLAHLATN